MKGVNGVTPMINGTQRPFGRRVPPILFSFAFSKRCSGIYFFCKSFCKIIGWDFMIDSSLDFMRIACLPLFPPLNSKLISKKKKSFLIRNVCVFNFHENCLLQKKITFDAGILWDFFDQKLTVSGEMRIDLSSSMFWTWRDVNMLANLRLVKEG